MLARITRGSKGLAEYLRNGRKQDSAFLRCDKDKIIPLYGNLNTFEKMENYLVNNESYKNNYMHITLSFNKEDTETLNSLTDSERINALQEMTKTYIKHHTTGYDEEEFVAYAEVHSPIIKEENSKERLEHIHIAIALFNVQDYTKLQTPFFGNGFMDNVLQTYVNKQFHLNLPSENKRHERKKEYQSKKARDRVFYKEQLKDIANKEQLLAYFKENHVVYKEVSTKNNHYFKIITQGDIKDINLRGKDFSHLEKFMDKGSLNKKEVKSFAESNAEKSLTELDAILEAFYEKQFQRIYQRRSCKSKQWFENRMKDEAVQGYSVETLPSIKEVLPALSEANSRLTSPVDFYAYEKQPITIKEISKQERKMDINISICKDKNVHTFVKDWEQITVDSYDELISTMKNHIYSPFIFNNGYRKGDNVAKSNNLLIFDFDNDTEQQTTIDEIRHHLQSVGIEAILLPTKSHNIAKNGIIAERFRLIIPLSSEFDCSNKELFREFQEASAKALGIYDFVDKQALRDRARAYQKSPAEAQAIILEGRFMYIEKLFERAEKNLASKSIKRKEEEKKIEEIRQNYKKPQNSLQSNALTYLNIDKAYDISMKELIMFFEPDSKLLSEGKYTYLKNARAKYSLLFDKNLAYDFKSDTTFNVISYVASQINSDSLYHIGYKIKEIMGIDCFEVNIHALQENIKTALTFVKNDKELENDLKTRFGVKFCKLDKSVLKIADQTIQLADLGFSKLDIINQFRENRENHHNFAMSMDNL